MDTYFPIPPRPVDKPFLMPIEDVFSISGRGTVVTGRVARAWCMSGDDCEIVGIKDTRKTVVTGVEMFNKLLDEGQAGDNIGTLLRGIEKDDVERGQVLAKPGSITPHKKFKCTVVASDKGRGRTAFAVLHGLPAPVLLPHDGRHGVRDAAGRQADGHAR